MRNAIPALVLTLASATSAWADLAPDPTNPTEPMGALVWLSGLAVLLAAGIWYMRRRKK